MRRPDLPHQIPPPFDQGADLIRLVRVFLGERDQRHNLGLHKRQVFLWDYPAIDHLQVPVQGLAGEDDAMIGFFGGHGGDHGR